LVGKSIYGCDVVFLKTKDEHAFIVKIREKKGVAFA